MKNRLPGEYHQSLDTATRLPGPDDLQKAVFHLAKWYDANFGMIMSPINQNLSLLNYVRRLALPLEVHTMTRRLNTITKFDFAYSDITAPLATTRRQPTTYPESQLMALVVIATKLLFPFDSDTVKRYPKTSSDPTTLRINWAAWLEAKTTHGKASEAALNPDGGLKPGSEIHVTDNDTLDMTDQQLDHYMDWYQQTWIKSNPPAQTAQSQEPGGIDKEILDMFPLHDVPERTKTREQNRQLDAEENVRLNARIKQVQSSLKPRRAISEDEAFERGLDILRPGVYYPRFTKLEDLERADNGAPRVFHEEAARTACLSVKALLLAVNRTEEKVEQWLADRRREDVFGDGREGDVDGDEREEDEEMAVIPETSPPGKLARDLDGLGIGQSPGVRDDDGDVDMEMLLE